MLVLSIEEDDKVANDVSELISSKDAAARLGIVGGVLANWRANGRGPRYLKLGRSVYYRPDDIRAWLDSCVVDPAERKAAAR